MTNVLKYQKKTAPPRHQKTHPARKPGGSLDHSGQRAPFPGAPAFDPSAGLRAPFGAALAIQTKLTVNAPGDRYEQEADRVAEQVMRMTDTDAALQRGPRITPLAGSGAQRLCSECEEEMIQAKPAPGGAFEADDATRTAIDAMTVGHPLPVSERAFFEPRLGVSLENVRIHANPQGQLAARMVHARAFTLGRDIAFGSGQYRPASHEGRQLMAHELAHTIQQGAVNRTKTPLPTRNHADGPRSALSRATTTLSRSPDPYIARVDCSTLPDSRCNNVLPCGVGGRCNMTYGACRCIGSLRAASPSSAVQDAGATCTPSQRGIPPSQCSIYAANSWWLPTAYVNNATCACQETPNSQTANCVRQFLQQRLANTPAFIKTAAAGNKFLETLNPPAYQAFVQTLLTPLIYRDHVDAYRNCCCTSGPAPYPAWVGVTSVPIQPCSLVGLSIRQFGSCHGTPGRW